MLLIQIKDFVKINTIFALTFMFPCLQISAQDFSKKDILSDLDYLKTSLEQAHLNLFAYTTKKEFDQNFQNVKNEISKDSFTKLEVFRLFQKVTAKANNAHTRIPFPVQSYFNYAESGGTLFPLEVAIENNKALIRKNWSNRPDIQVGDELLSINGKTISEIIAEISSLISAERSYFKLAQIEGFSLPRYYWLAFGEQNRFEVEISSNRKLVKLELNAIKVIDDYEMKRDEIVDNSRYLTFYPKTAYLHPGAFGGNLDEYKKFIDSSFVEINKNKTKNLIVDLRNHSGGDEPFGNYLVSYFADKPFKWNSNFKIKISSFLKENTRKTKDTTQAYWKKILSYDDGIEAFDHEAILPQPKEKRYNGKVYVLVNRLSYSQSTVTAAQIQDYGFGTIVGEETGEFPNLYASIYNYPLPNTGISVDVAKGKIERMSGTDNGKGVIPDIKIKDHLLDEDDEILKGLLEIIKE